MTFKELPENWVWTEPRQTPSALLYCARDKRWNLSVPDVVDTSQAAVAAYAHECEAAKTWYAGYKVPA